MATLTNEQFKSLYDIQRSGLYLKMGYPTLYNFLTELLCYESRDALLLLKAYIIKKYGQKK